MMTVTEWLDPRRERLVCSLDPATGEQAALSIELHVTAAEARRLRAALLAACIANPDCPVVSAAHAAVAGALSLEATE